MLSFGTERAAIIAAICDIYKIDRMHGEIFHKIQKVIAPARAPERCAARMAPSRAGNADRIRSDSGR
jgi:hypothetical protein